MKGSGDIESRHNAKRGGKRERRKGKQKTQNKTSQDYSNIGVKVYKEENYVYSNCKDKHIYATMLPLGQMNNSSNQRCILLAKGIASHHKTNKTSSPESSCVLLFICRCDWWWGGPEHTHGGPSTLSPSSHSHTYCCNQSMVGLYQMLSSSPIREGGGRTVPSSSGSSASYSARIVGLPSTRRASTTRRSIASARD